MWDRTPLAAQIGLKPRLRLAEIVEQTGGASEGARAKFRCEVFRAAGNVARVSIERFCSAVGSGVRKQPSRTGCNPERHCAIGRAPSDVHWRAAKARQCG
jgi:hypothetical protein